MVKQTADAADRAILRTLIDDPTATGVQISERTGLARNTVRTRLNRYETEPALLPFEHRIAPAFLGFPLRAYVTTTVIQRELDAVGEALASIPEVLEVSGVAGGADLIILIVARDTDDLYRVAGAILDIPGVVRTETGLVMRELVPYRAAQLVDDSEKDVVRRKAQS
ncbi:Lrp/AsnC family transcriptional regulator [Microbacterium alcoholitolerans]|uniref:Lrp/AsnC family transcriptional regulator n=1 Tax=unclassified Microbacterium TaxID=2609290 RepID=UPI003D18090F